MKTWLTSIAAQINSHRVPEPDPEEIPTPQPHPTPDKEQVPDHNPTFRK